MSVYKSPFADPGTAKAFAVEQGLLDWDEVRRRWNAQSGESISRARVWQIGQRAEAKLRRKLAAYAAEYLGP